MIMRSPCYAREHEQRVGTLTTHSHVTGLTCTHSHVTRLDRGEGGAGLRLERLEPLPQRRHVRRVHCLRLPRLWPLAAIRGLSQTPEAFVRFLQQSLSRDRTYAPPPPP